MDEHSAFAGPALIEPLNPRETEILGYITAGLSNQQIAARLHLSQETVKWYNKQIFSKLGVSSRTQAAARAAETGLLAAEEAPSARAESRPRHNLPTSLTSFIGRGNEVAEIGRLLENRRLLVLTGPGGSGKTRLAVQAARANAARYTDGAWLVELASLSDPALIPQAAAEVLRLSSTSGESVVSVLNRFLARKQLLLVLDNFEHLLEGAGFISEILAAAPRVSVLVTSREPLHIYGEQEYPVAPLGLPDLSPRETARHILDFDAVKLFLERARAVRPNLALTDPQAAAVAQICIRLDGLPLALELAATQTKMYTFQQLASLLNESLDALPPGPRDLPSRQRTLRGTIEWSYSLLSPEEKSLFARLSVFSGGGTLAAVAAVCGSPDLGDIRERLAALVDKSIVVARESPDGELRFSQLETIREYALERLRVSGQLEEMHRRHAGYYAGLIERADPDMRGERQPYWFAHLRAERDNLRAALQWSFEQEAPDEGLRMVGSLAYFWYYHGRSIEDALRWAQLALERSQGYPADVRGRVQLAAGRIAIVSGDVLTARGILQEARQNFIHTGDEAQAAWAALWLSSCYFTDLAEMETARRICQEGLEYFRGAGDVMGTSQALNVLGELDRWAGEYESARQRYEECLALSRQTGELLRIAMQYSNLALVSFHQQRPEDIPELTRQSIHYFHEVGNDYGMICSLQGMVGEAILTGRPERAARLLSASFTQMTEMGAKYQPNDDFENDIFIEQIKAQIGEEAYQRAWDQGAGMSYAETLAYAFEGVP